VISFKHRLCFFVCCYLFSYHLLLSQCSSLPFEAQVIYSDSTIISSLIIEDTQIDDLSNPIQGVCSVNLTFAHDNVREIIVKLVSPSGQSVDLIGPINPRASTTDNSIWDIGFTTCADVPTPDSGFSNPYTNEDNWAGFGGRYNGTYHPNVGCLEDFDTGLVNGLWSLEIFSISSFYLGDLLSFEIEFCDNSTTSCVQCVAMPAVFNNPMVPAEYCQGDESLLLDLNSSIPDQGDYTHEFYIIQDDIIVDLQASPDLRSYQPGVYQICGLSYFDRQGALLPADFSFSGLNDLFNSSQSPLCAKFSDTCLMVNILAYSDTLRIDTTICDGSIFNFNGQDYDVEGQYKTSLGNVLCDTLVLIDLKTVSLEALISNDSDLLTCDNDKITLSVGSSVLTANTNITWKTATGNIEGDVNSSSILATQMGAYWLVLEEGSCADSFFVDIDVDTDLPILNIALPDTINCSSTSVELLLNSNPAAISYSWRGPLGYVSTEQNIQVSRPGVYTVDVQLPTGCTSSISQEVFSNFAVPDLDISISNISCDISFGEVIILDQSADNNYSFSGGVLNTDSQSIEYSSEGRYTVTSTSLINGCTKDSTFDISSDIDLPVLSFDPVGDIDCANLSVDIIINSTIPISSYDWSGPNGSIPIDEDNITVAESGIYQVVVTASNGCIDSLEQEIFAVNTDLPTIALNADTITCTTSTVQIELEVNRTGLTYRWYNDTGFSSDEEDPLITDGGKYYLEASVSSNCTILDSITVLENFTQPSLQVEATKITCTDLESQLIIINQEAGVSYVWTDPLGNQLPDQEPMVSLPGMYLLEGIGSNGCMASVQQVVEADTIRPLAFATAPTSLLCDTKQVELSGEGSSAGDNFTYSWTTTEGSIIARANTLNVLVGSAGLYELSVVNTETGCQANATTSLQEVTTDLSDFMFDTFDPPCSGTSTGSISVGPVDGGVGPYTFSVDGFNYQESPDFDGLPAGSYKLSVKDDFGCGFSKNAILQDGLNVTIDLEDTYTINLGDELEVISEINTNGDPLRSIQWELADQEIASGPDRVVVRPLTNTAIAVSITTDSGCEAITTAIIEVTKERDVYTPNVFDPSSFGDNSVFKVIATNAIEEISSISIYDRWGNKVYNTGPYDPKEESKTWDGTHSSQNLIPGVYVYLIEVLLIDGEQRKISGDVLIIR